MKRWYMIVLVGIFLVGGVYIYLHRHDLALPWHSRSASAPDQSSGPAQILWTLIDRSAEGFKVEMPQGTREIEVPAYNLNGSADPVAMIYAYPDPSTSFSISWADNPPVARATDDNPEHTFEEARDGALARTQAVLVSEARSTRQGFPVRDFTGRNQNGGVFSARLVLAGRRLYMLIVSFPAASARRDDDVNRFFDSFHIVSTAPGN